MCLVARPRSPLSLSERSVRCDGNRGHEVGEITEALEDAEHDHQHRHDRKHRVVGQGAARRVSRWRTIPRMVQVTIRRTRFAEGARAAHVLPIARPDVATEPPYPRARPGQQRQHPGTLAARWLLPNRGPDTIFGRQGGSRWRSRSIPPVQSSPVSLVERSASPNRPGRGRCVPRRAPRTSSIWSSTTPGLGTSVALARRSERRTSIASPPAGCASPTCTPRRSARRAARAFSPGATITRTRCPASPRGRPVTRDRTASSRSKMVSCPRSCAGTATAPLPSANGT